MAKLRESRDGDQEDKLNLDTVLEDEIGIGKFQLQAFALFCVISFCYGLKSNDFIFVTERVKTRCKIPECEENYTDSYSTWVENAIPSLGDSFDNCHRFAKAHAWNSSSDFCSASMFNRNETLQCTDYVYHNQNSAVYEFDLACDEWRWFLFGGLPLLGSTFAMPLTGTVSDRWGRRFALSVTAFNLAWINIIRYWASSYNLYIFIAFLASVFGSASMGACSVLALELVSPSRRMAAVSLLNSCSDLGSVAKGLIASTQPYWRDLILMLHVPLITSVSYYWIGPESVRWLMSKDRIDDAKKLLLKAAKMNGRELSDTTMKILIEGATFPKPTASREANLICLIWKHKTILLRCIIILVWSLSSVFMVKGLAISSLSISGNKYVNFCTVTAIAIPGYWTATLLNNKIGRKPLLCALFLMGGFCQLGCIFLSKGPAGIQLILFLLTKFCTAAVNITLAVYRAELYPTSHRSRLSGLTSTFARFGGFAALLIPTLADRVWAYLPNTIFSILAFTSGALTLLTPETLGASLPVTMEEAALLGRDELKIISNLPRIICRKQHDDDDDDEELVLSNLTDGDEISVYKLH